MQTAPFYLLPFVVFMKPTTHNFEASGQGGAIFVSREGAKVFKMYVPERHHHPTSHIPLIAWAALAKNCTFRNLRAFSGELRNKLIKQFERRV